MHSFRRFMEGRYGWDNLNTALAITGLALGLLGNIPVLRWMLYIQLVPLAVILYRMLSRNTERRYAENMRFWSLFERAKQLFHNIRCRGGRQNRDTRTHKLYSCPHCAKTLRVPRGKGRIMITCPVCHERFPANT